MSLADRPTADRRNLPAITCAILATMIMTGLALASLFLVARAGPAAASEATEPTVAFVDVWVSAEIASGLAEKRRAHGRDLAPVVAALAADLAATLPGQFSAGRLAGAFPGADGLRADGPLTASRVLPALRIRPLAADRLRILVSTTDGEVARKAAELAVGPTLAALGAPTRTDVTPRLVLSAVAAPGVRPGEVILGGMLMLALAGAGFVSITLAARGVGARRVGLGDRGAAAVGQS